MERVPEVLLAAAYLMVVVGGVRDLAATRVLRAVQYTARLTVVVGDVNSLGVQRVQKGALIFVLPTVVVGGAVMKVALELLEGNQVCVSGMVVARDAKEKIAQRVQKAFRAFASHMEVAVDAKLQDAPKGRKGALCSARLMVGESGALLQVAPRELKVARPIAKATVEGKGVHSKVAGIAQRVCMVAPTSVWRMGVVSAVPCLSAQRVRGDGLTTVSDMAGERGASLKDVVRVHKGALTSVRHMGEEKDALGVIPDQFMATKLLVLATHLLGGKQASVHSIVVWFRIRGFMVVLLWDRWFKTLNLGSQRR